MILIAGSNDRRDADDRSERDLFNSIGTGPKRAQRQQGEDSVFGQVRRFAHDEVNTRDCLRRNVRSQPNQERLDEARSVFGRHQIG